MRTRLIEIALAAASLLIPAFAAAAYPEKPVTIIVPYQAGQGTDIATRYFADHLGKALGQPFVVENIAGAGGMVGTQAAARAPADGYTLVMGTNATHVLNEFLYTSAGFDPRNDFEPVILAGTLPMVLVTHPDAPHTSMQDIIAAAAQGASATDIAAPSTTARLVFELLREQSGAPLLMIPYKGSAAAINGVAAGKVSLSIDTITATRPHIETGTLRPIAVTSRTRTPLLPGVPSVAEQGLAEFEVIAWNALYAPKGSPPNVITTLNQTLQNMLARPETRAALHAMGYEPGGGSPADLAQFAEAQRQKWAPLIERGGLRNK